MTLTLKNISFKIEKSFIIKDLSLHVENGECLALLGPSGCGKSSTLRLIAGLEKVYNGKIYIDDLEITNMSPVDRRIGMVFQSYALFPHLNIFENLSLGLKIRGTTPTEQIRRVNSVLALMQLDLLANRKPSELSGGQRQRVALARALLRDPLVYLLDEPMSNLDAQLREELRPEIKRLILNGGRPVVYVTHDQSEAMAMANKIALLKDGQLEQIGTPQELYHYPKSIFAATFIGRPQINLLPPVANTIRAIRPEDIYLDNLGIDCKLVHREWLGNSQVWLLSSNLGSLRMICDANIEPFEGIKVSFKEDNIHKFCKNTQKRINT
ncbi:MAG: ABC transporter ATP-binding protein [Trichodesmium sp. MAG_R04]|nr:ABC transporter ATP-binding protein [Trichodesmium sp. MAG_R04]